MNSTVSSNSLARRSKRRWVSKHFRSSALVGVLTAFCIAAAACGGGGSPTGSLADQFEAEPPAQTPSSAPEDSPVTFASTRTGAGIAAADGNLQAIQGANPCGQPGASDTIIIAYTGADLAELSEIGFGLAEVEDPVHTIAAYVAEVNLHGGINGHCLELDAHSWSLSDPIGSFIEVCSELRQRNPLFYFNFELYDSGLQCATFGAPLPNISLFSALPESALAEGGYAQYVDQGTVEHLVAVSADIGLVAGIIGANNRVGLLHGTGPSTGMAISAAEEAVRERGLSVVASADIPSEFADLSLLLPELQVGLLRSDLSDDERAAAQRNLESLSPDLRAQLTEMERYYTEAATRFQEAGVSAVTSTAHWADVRRMMRAAELIDWTPVWLVSDMQPASLLTADAPQRQVNNLRQVSSRRAAGDLVPVLDQGCLAMRNAGVEGNPFNHRPHTDGWNLIMTVCDYLDVAFAALTRTDGSVDHVDHLQFLDALHETRYDTPYGGLITFSITDRNGGDLFRVLEPDPDCVLNYWGCMRATTDWTPLLHGHHELSSTNIAVIEELMAEMGHGHGESETPEVEADAHNHE